MKSKDNHPNTDKGAVVGEKRPIISGMRGVLILIMIAFVVSLITWTVAKNYAIQFGERLDESERLCRGLCSEMGLNYSGTNGWGDACFCKTHEFENSYTTLRFDLYVER